MTAADQSPADTIRLHEADENEQGLIVLRHEIDDQFETGGSYEYVMQVLRGVSADIRLKLFEIGAIPWALPETEGNNPNAKYLDAITEYSGHSARRLGKAVKLALNHDKKILSIGGNHLRATELLGLLEACHKLGYEPAIVWMDAHPDINTPTATAEAGKTLTGNVHGMVSAIALGEGPEELLTLLKNAPYLKPENIVYVGVNAPDKAENDRLIAKGIKVFPISKLDMDGLRPVTEALTEINERLGEKAIWWNELDVDVLDDKESQGKVMPNTYGMTARELQTLYLWMNKNLNLLGMGVSEIAPAKDPDGKMAGIVSQVVGASLGIPNIEYQKHLRKYQGGHIAAAANVIQQPLKQPLPTKGRNRMLDHLAGAAAAIVALVGIKMFTEKPEAARPADGIVSVDRTITPRNAHPNALQSRADFLKAFTEYRFREFAMEYRKAVEAGTEAEKDQALQKLVDCYGTIVSAAKDDMEASDLGQVAFSEFFQVFEQRAGNPYQQFMKAVREKYRKV